MFSGKKDQEEDLRENSWMNSLIWFGICLFLLTILII
jgi:hypothetical protein